MVRDIRRLDATTKEEYGLVLASFLTKLNDMDVFQMQTFYKVLGYIELPKKYRRKVLELFFNHDNDGILLETRLESLLSQVKGQERDILRFTLMQDLLSLAMANNYMNEDKKRLIRKLQHLLRINDEQMKIFTHGEDSKDQFLIKDKASTAKSLCKMSITKAIALGIPLSLLYFSQHNAYRHNYKSFTLLKVDKKLNPHKGALALGKYLLLGGILYSGLLWGANHKHRSQMKLEEMLKVESETLNQRCKKYLEEDLYYMEKIFSKEITNEYHMNTKVLMEKTLHYVERIS